MSEVLNLHAGRRRAVQAITPLYEAPPQRTGPIEAIERHEAVAVIRLANEPGVFWSLSGAAAFEAALNELAATAEVEAVVLQGDAVFAEASVDDESAAAILAGIADRSTPVFAALDGDAVGAGLALALACSGRVAKAGSRFALPAVLGGRLPAASTIQRLTALSDIDTAARLMVFGETIDAAAALRAGLIDGMVARGVVRLAVALAQSHDRSAASPPRPQSISAELPSVRYQIAGRARGQAAPLAAVQAMEAALRLPPRRSAIEIGEIAARLAATEQARALRHASAAETASKHREARGSTPPDFAMRLAWPMRREAIHLLDEGASPAQIDRSLIRYGFAEGPFHEADRSGFAQVFSIDGRAVATDRAWRAYTPILDFMLEGGRAGGAQPGWFRRGEGEALQFDPEVERILAASALFQRLQRRRKSDEEVERRLFQGMIVGSIELMQYCPNLNWTDVDALWTTRLGFPRWRGGPLFQGALAGWSAVSAGLEAGECGRTLGGAGDLLKLWGGGDPATPRIDIGPAHPQAEPRRTAAR